MCGQYIGIDDMITHLLTWRTYRIPEQETASDIEEYNSFEEPRQLKRKRLLNLAENYKFFDCCKKKRVRFMKNYPKNKATIVSDTKMVTVGKYNWGENKNWYQKR